jgi:putative membrane-bound dehydrogenase-like protein
MIPRVAKLILAAFWAWGLMGFRPAIAVGKPDQPGTFPVGLARIDITPSYPVRLSGFAFRHAESEGVSQRLWAKALAIGSDSDGAFVLLAVDNLNVPAWMVQDLAGRLQRKHGISPDRLAVTFTHTHSAPMLKGTCPTLFGQPIPPPHQERIDRYSAELLDKLEAVAEEALRNRQAAHLSWGIGKVGFAVNRRTPGGPVDHDLPILVVRAPDKSIRGIWVNYACHCVTLSFNKISGDWAGYAQQAIEDDHPGAIALVSIGCGADANPNSHVTGDKVEIAARQGREIADEVNRLLSGFLEPLTSKPQAARRLLRLPLDALPTRQEWEERAKRQDALGYHARYQLGLLDRGEALPTAIEYPVQVWSFGEQLGMVFLPGEVVVDYALRWKRELDGKRLWINAYSNDCPCYIPSERVLREGGYEAGGAMVYYGLPAWLKPGLEETIVTAVKELLGASFAPRHDGDKTHGTRPLSPQQSAACLVTSPEFRVELMAAEPLVHSPVAIDWGPDGRLFVAEMTDYPEGGPDGQPGGRVRVLFDRDGDGRYDDAAVLVQGIPLPTGVLAWHRGVLICAAPDILYAEDADGDGRAEQVRTLYSGFGTGNAQARVNSLEHGLDGWIYGSCGLFGGTITCRSLEGKVTGVVALGDRDFRIRPRTGELEPASGRTQQGRVRDDWGNWFGCDSGTLLMHYPLDDHYLRRNPHLALPANRVYVPQDQGSPRLYPALAQLQLFALSGPRGGVTAACGLGIYRDDLLGSGYQGNAFVCEPVNHVVHRRVLQPRGTSFVGRRSPEEQDREFLASTDPWFRPVQVRTGPDGGLWIVDMYRFLIEHPRWIPPADLQRVDPRAGSECGRIYRVAPRDKPVRSVPRLHREDPAALVEALDHPNGWVRDTAMHLLAFAPAEQLRAFRERLEELARSAPRPESRVQALCLLDQTGLLEADLLLTLLRDGDARVRRHAVRLAPSRLRNGEPLQAWLALARDPDPQVRLQVAFALGEVADPAAAKTLAELLHASQGEEHLVAAGLSSLRPDNVLEVLRHWSRLASEPQRVPAGMRQAIATLFAAQEPQVALASLREILIRHPDDGQAPPTPARWQEEILLGLLEAARRHPQLRLEEAGNPVRALLDDTSARARKLVADEASPEAERAYYLEFLGHQEACRQQDLDLLARFLSPSAAATLQTRALQVLHRIPDDRVADTVLAEWTSRTPALKGACLDLLLVRKNWTRRLLEAVQARRIPLADIDATRRQLLLESPDPAIRELARQAFAGGSSPDRARLVEEYRARLGASGNPALGKQLFARHCSGCHRLEDVGHPVGPDLAAVAGKPPDFLLQEILDPNRNVDSRYTVYRVLTRDGRTLSGLLAAENAASLLLRGQEGKEELVLRSDVEQFQGTGRSLMPEGFEKELAPEAMADLLAYLASARPPPKRVPGNRPEVVVLDQGRLRLLATNASIHGADITLEPGFWNIGYWHGVQDYVSWTVYLPQAAVFDVWFDFACAPHAAGNVCRLEGTDPPLDFKVPDTGGWSQYRWHRAGTVRLAAGTHRLVLRPAGATIRGALLDLRGIHLVPQGTPPDAGNGDAKEETAAQIAARLLDDSVAPEQRIALAQTHAHRAAAVIGAMTANLGDQREEYRRIPWIWRVAVAAGRKNDPAVLLPLLELSLPAAGQPMRHWQIVVIGGGVIHGLSQEGVWPKERIAEILRPRLDLGVRWQQALEEAAKVADDPQVPVGTRYDALRMIAVDSWDRRGAQLLRYLRPGLHPELHMGAISGLSDLQSPHVGRHLLAALPHLSAENRKLAVESLLRTRDRIQVLLDALEQGTADKGWLSPEQKRQLLQAEDEGIRQRAARILGP